MQDNPVMRTVLVANRGEIAVRIIRTCRELGLSTVAVYSDADADALHVRMADHAHRIGPPPARQSYLSIDAIVKAAQESGSDVIHPGYGLLSEDAAFARAVVDAGLVFVGPSADVIARMGDKVAARDVARSCGVPVPPGSDGPVADAEQALAAAEVIGWPVVVKASFGGGGRGMRVVQAAAGLDTALAAAAREAGAAFGRSEVHLERYLERVRHVEVQVLGDAYGTVVHLGDRDCTVQRRHQKLIEEAPAASLPSTVRGDLHDAALRLAREVGYVGAGTVEFLVLAETEEYFFLEMNTRLQVEHGVTEMVTGIDLVAAQLAVAGGEKLWFTQDDVRLAGHAIQARIAAEDPWESFRPAPGHVPTLIVPQGPWVRCDMGIQSGDTVAAEYDSMFGKILARGETRDAARARLIAALDELRVDGIPTTAPYLSTVLASAVFAADAHDTGSVERDWAPDPAQRPVAPQPSPAAGARPARTVRIATDRGPVEVTVVEAAQPRGTDVAASGRPVHSGGAAGPAADGPGAPPTAPMDATVAAVAVQEGTTVAVGDVLVILEAMKMEISITSSVAGTVDKLHVAVGAPVAAGMILAEVTPAG